MRKALFAMWFAPWCLFCQCVETAGDWLITLVESHGRIYRNGVA